MKEFDKALIGPPIQDWYQDVLDFHKAMGCHIGTTPCDPGPELRQLREDLEYEELRELDTATKFHDLPEVADAIADLIYVLIGRAITYGIDLRPVWDEVQRTNMAKASGPVREDGKKLKPPGWQPPDIAGILAKQKPLS